VRRVYFIRAELAVFLESDDDTNYRVHIRFGLRISLTPPYFFILHHFFVGKVSVGKLNYVLVRFLLNSVLKKQGEHTKKPYEYEPKDNIVKAISERTSSKF
jgi:hypothetical protein